MVSLGRVATRSSERFRFVNLDGSEPQPFSAVFKWAIGERLNGKRRSRPWEGTTPSVRPDLTRLKVPPARGEGARLTWIGHASWLVQLDGISLLIDPVFAEGLGPGIKRHLPPALAVAELPAIAAQLVSHNHRDHLDMPSVRAVGAKVVAGLGMSRYFEATHLPCTELDWWSETEIEGVRVRLVPSQHWSRRGLSDTNESLWGGFVIEGSSARLYHSGDTAYFAGFSEIGRRVGPIDAALLPIGAYKPQWFMRTQHMNPEDAVQAFSDLGAQTFLAMHWGTFKLTDERRDEPPERLQAEWSRRRFAPERCVVLPVGGSFEVSRAVRPPP